MTRSPTIVNATSDTKRSGKATIRTRPAVDHNRPAQRRERRAALEHDGRDSLCADEPGTGGPVKPAVDPEHDVGVEHLQQRLEVAAAGRGEERVDDPAAGRALAASGSAAPRPPGAPGSRAGAPPRALRSRSGRSPRRGSRTCRAGRTPAARPASASRARPAAPARRLGEQRLLLGITSTSSNSARPAQRPVLDGLLAPARRARSMSRQIRLTIVVSHPRMFSTSCGVGAVEPEPGLLHGVVGLGGGAQHPVRDRPQVIPVVLELLGLPFGRCHRSHPLVVPPSKR